MIRRLLWVFLALLAAVPAHATTARDLRSRMSVDGYATEFADDEKVFGFIPGTDELQEPIDDSKWGVNEDLNQIRITWDARNLYIAGEGRIWDNNMVLFIDSVPFQGLGAMDQLNSWRRNFFFDSTAFAGVTGFAPDLFGATWDLNQSPHLIIPKLTQSDPTKIDVRDLEIASGFFSAAASFDKGNTGRAMELVLPWRTVFLGPVGGAGVKDTVVSIDGVIDTVAVFPPGTRLRIAGVVTAGADGTGGPDCAPDNTRGMTSNSSDAVYLDNWATVDIDRNDDTGRGHGGPDGVADWGVSPLERVTLRIPPIPSTQPQPNLRFKIHEITVDRPAFAPDRGEIVKCFTHMDPTPDPTNTYHQINRQVFSADISDLRGRVVRTRFSSLSIPLLALVDGYFTWDGRDDQGQLVPPGVYIIREVLEPNLGRSTRSVVVVR